MPVRYLQGPNMHPQIAVGAITCHDDDDADMVRGQAKNPSKIN